MDFFVFSCNPDDPSPINEEIITRANVHPHPVGEGSALVLFSSDPDGDGGTAPVITGGSLALGKTYTGVITLLNEAANPMKTSPPNLQEEGEDHRFSFPSTGLTGAFELAYTVQMQRAIRWDSKPAHHRKSGFGHLKAHPAPPAQQNRQWRKNGDITNAGGETDVELVLTVWFYQFFQFTDSCPYTKFFGVGSPWQFTCVGIPIIDIPILSLCQWSWCRDTDYWFLSLRQFTGVGIPI